MTSCSGFLSQADFWQKEGDAPILKFNLNNWLENHTDEATVHAQGWLRHLGVEPSTIEVDLKPVAAEKNRIFRADANRTYRSEPNRDTFVKLLCFTQQKFGDYQQSLGYVAGLLSLFFDPATVFKALTVLNDSPKFLPGYWRGEATACAVDGYVAIALLRPAIREKLLSLGLLPETFVQKWFAGLCIHHLPYHVLVHYLDRFFEFGNHYLFQFFIAFFDEFEHEIMTAKSNPEANLLIRLESPSPDRLLRVIEAASTERYVQQVKQLDLHQRRIVAFHDNLSKRLQSANEGMWGLTEEITFSDEED